jgi:glutaredoxin
MPDAEEIVVYGTGWCADCTRSRSALERMGRAYRYVDIEADADAASVARSLAGVQKIPVISLPGGAVLVEPSDIELAAAVTLV